MNVSGRQIYRQSQEDKYRLERIFSDQEKTGVPVMIFPGWTGDIQTYSVTMNAFAEIGRSSIMVELEEDHRLDHAQLNMNYAFRYNNALRESGIDKVDGVGYSAGSISLILAAILNPEKFNNIILISPTGLDGSISKSRLVANFSREVVSGLFTWLKTNEGRLMMASVSKSVLKRLFGSPVRSWKQIISMTNLKLTEELLILRKQGINISVVHGVHDKLISTTFINELKDQNIIDSLHLFDGAHPDFLFKAKECIKIVDDALEQLKLEKLYKEV